jgi:hypothetical protein
MQASRSYKGEADETKPRQEVKLDGSLSTVRSEFSNVMVEATR